MGLDGFGWYCNVYGWGLMSLCMGGCCNVYGWVMLWVWVGFGGCMMGIAGCLVVCIMVLNVYCNGYRWVLLWVWMGFGGCMMVSHCGEVV
jgi:hypothetical protein